MKYLNRCEPETSAFSCLPLATNDDGGIGGGSLLSCFILWMLENSQLIMQNRYECDGCTRLSENILSKTGTRSYCTELIKSMNITI